ncbi:MAG TPA: hypothetical protein VIY52_03355 [Streptosporangiaceae bacterium]
MTEAVPAKSPIHGARYAQLGEGSRQLSERAGVAGQLNVSGGDRVHALDIPQEGAGGRGDPAPPQDFLDGDVGKDVCSSLQRRSRGAVSVDGQQREAVDQQVKWTRITWCRREG